MLLGAPLVGEMVGIRVSGVEEGANEREERRRVRTWCAPWCAPGALTGARPACSLVRVGAFLHLFIYNAQEWAHFYIFLYIMPKSGRIFLSSYI